MPEKRDRAMAFARRFREVIAQDATQLDTAMRLDISPAYVSAVGRGQRPSRKFVLTFCREYEQDPAEWLRLARHEPDTEPEGEGPDEREEIAVRAAEEALRRVGFAQNPAARIRAAIRELTRSVPLPELAGVEIDPFAGRQVPIPPEDVEIIRVVMWVLAQEREGKEEEEGPA